jgi:hypothetical protein
MVAETDSVEQNCNTDELVVKKLLISYKTKRASQLDAQTQRSKGQLAAYRSTRQSSSPNKTVIPIPDEEDVRSHTASIVLAESATKKT